MLALVEPACIHVETKASRQRIYDYEPEFDDEENQRNIIYEGGYYDKELKKYVEFIDIPSEKKQYYLFYDFEKCSFHTPIHEENLGCYPSLEIKEVGQIITKGHDINDLVSTQFIAKVLALIERGTYKLVEW